MTHSNKHTHSVRLLWTRDQHVAETSTWQHLLFTRDRYPSPLRNSKPQSPQMSAFVGAVNGICQSANSEDVKIQSLACYHVILPRVKVNVSLCFNQHCIANTESGVYPCLNNTDTPKFSFYLTKNKVHVLYKDHWIKLCEEIKRCLFW